MNFVFGNSGFVICSFIALGCSLMTESFVIFWIRVVSSLFLSTSSEGNLNDVVGERFRRENFARLKDKRLISPKCNSCLRRSGKE